MIRKDIVELSILMKNLRTDLLQTEEEQQRLFEKILSVRFVTKASFENMNEAYEKAVQVRLALATEYIPSR